MSVKILGSAIVAGPSRVHSSGVRGGSCSASDKGEGHEVGCHSQSVREEVTYLTSRLVK
jgi:hypothetical protein